MEKLKRNFFDWASCLRDSLPRHCWNVIYKLAIVNATHHLSFIFSSSFHLCMSLNATLTSLWQRHWSVIIHCTHQPQHAILQLSKAYSRKWWKVLRLKKPWDKNKKILWLAHGPRRLNHLNLLKPLDESREANQVNCFRLLPAAHGGLLPFPI